MKSFFLIVSTVLAISLKAKGQTPLDTILINHIKLIDSVKLKLDTTCYNLTYYYNDFDNSCKCGVMEKNIRIGRWVSFDEEGLPVSISYFTNKGTDSLFVGLVNKGNNVKNIYIKSPTIWASFYQDYLETLTWEDSDTTRIKYSFYPNGGIKEFGGIYLPKLDFLRKPLPFEEGKGKNGLWLYFDVKGVVVKTEIWSKGVLVEN